MIAAAAPRKDPIPVLIADDSIVFRRYMRDMIDDSPDIVICGEAKHGIEALDLVLKLRPRVILMDMEMPLMDGMTALQHLMIHCPTPTIMFSSLTGEGTFRAFDALKSGAVDFLSKDLLFDSNRQEVFRRMFTRKILSAAQMTVHCVEPVFELIQNPAPEEEPATRVVFCEECGARNVLDAAAVDSAVYCRECGDLLIEYKDVQRYRRNTFVTVFAGGDDSYRSLLNIIPKFGAELGGSIIVVMRAESAHIDTFTEYLDSISPMKVLRAREGMGLEGGFCYVAAAKEQIGLQQFSAQQTLVRMRGKESESGPIDLMMTTVAAALRKRCAGVLLSGNDLDGIRGVETLIGSGGEGLVLNPAACLSSRLARTAQEKLTQVKVMEDDTELAKMIVEFCSQARSGGAVV